MPNLIAPPYRGPSAIIPLEPQPPSGPVVNTPSNSVDLLAHKGSLLSPSKKLDILNNNTVEIHPQSPIVVPTIRNESESQNLTRNLNVVSLIPVTIVPQTLHPFVHVLNGTSTSPLVTIPITTTVLCNLACAQNAHCEITQGIPKCVCNVGWTGDGSFCVGKSG